MIRAWGKAVAWWWQRPGRAVILDTETTDFGGAIIEIAITDAADGSVLFDSLVDPKLSIHPEAAQVHGITDRMVAGAPTWPELWPAIREVVGSRVVLAWNAPFDKAAVSAECWRHRIAPPEWRWRCLMRHAAKIEKQRWRRLNGGHRALGDTQQAWQELCVLAGSKAVAVD